MGHTRDETTQHLAARWCWEVASSDDSRVARRLYRTPVIERVDRLDEGAGLDDFVHVLPSLGVMTLFEQACGAGIRRAMVPFVHDVLRDGLKTRCGLERRHALPSWLCRDEARMPLVGFNAPQVRHGVCHRRATTRQGARAPGPIGPETLAQTIGKWNLRDLAMVCHGAMRALAAAGVVGATSTGLAEGTALDTTARDTGCGPVTRTVRLAETRGQVHAIDGTVYGGNVLRRLDARTQMPLAVKVGPMQEPEARWARALVTPARLHLAGSARLATVVFDQGLLAGSTLWWLDQQDSRCVVPAQTHMAVTAEARAHAAAGADRTVGRRVPSVRHGHGKDAWSERLETAVVGITGLPTDDHYGPPEHAHQANRRDFQAHAIHAVVVRTWQGQD